MLYFKSSTVHSKPKLVWELIGSGLQIWHGIRILGGLTSAFLSSIHDLWLYKLRVILIRCPFIFSLGILCFAVSADPCGSGQSVLAAHYGNYAFLCLRAKGHHLACVLLSSSLQWWVQFSSSTCCYQPRLPEKTTNPQIASCTQISQFRICCWKNPQTWDRPSWRKFLYFRVFKKCFFKLTLERGEERNREIETLNR